MISKRQQIIGAIVLRLERILTANGYETDLGLQVADWQVNWNEDDLPAISVCDTVAAVGFIGDDPDATKQWHTLPVLLRIFLKSDTRAEDARKYLADVAKAIGEDPYWTTDNVQLAVWTKLTKSGLIVPDENFEIGGAAVELEIAYLTQSFNSYE